MSGKSMKRARQRAALAELQALNAARALEKSVEEMVGTFKRMRFNIRLGIALKIITRSDNVLRRRVWFMLFLAAILLLGFALGFYSYSHLISEIF